jgi:hypothetical protein
MAVGRHGSGSWLVTIIPTCRSTVPTSYRSIPTSCLMIPTSYRSIPTGCLTIPTTYISIPTGYLMVPTVYASIPTSCLMIPTSYTSIPTSCLKVPMAYMSCPTEAGILGFVNGGCHCLGARGRSWTPMSFATSFPPGTQVALGLPCPSRLRPVLGHKEPMPSQPKYILFSR